MFDSKQARKIKIRKSKGEESNLPVIVAILNTTPADIMLLHKLPNNRAYCSAVSLDTQEKLHISLCHPGVTRMMHFIRSRNLSFS